MSINVSELRVSPPAVERGGSVTLQCVYELQGDDLYCVKWYRGYREFYRYSPTDKPNTKVFPFSGINVDVSINVVFMVYMFTEILNLKKKIMVCGWIKFVP